MPKLLENQLIVTEEQYTVSLLFKKSVAGEYQFKMKLMTVRANSKAEALGMVILNIGKEPDVESYDLSLWVVGRTGK